MSYNIRQQFIKQIDVVPMRLKYRYCSIRDKMQTDYSVKLWKQAKNCKKYFWESNKNFGDAYF